MKMLKKIFIFILVIIIIAVAAIFIYRYQILQYSAEAIIRKILPDYVKIDKIDFRPQDNKLLLDGFKISNPPGFSNDYLLDIEEVVCAYRMKGKGIVDGIEILEPVFKAATLNIERLGDGQLNLMKMQAVIEAGAAKEPKNAASQGINKSRAYNGMVGNRKISGIIKLPATFLLQNSKIIFLDRFNQPSPHKITFENVNSTMTLRLDDIYTNVLSLASTGQGDFNGKADEIIRWDIVFNPTTSRLTMSNRFEVSGVDLLPFEPYYEKYSPLVFTSGRFSGTLVFDFDNGSIGSTNEIHLSGLKFGVKSGNENAQFWDTTVPDLVKYFSTPYGEIIFDFKIKGDMSAPKFYLGPISKQALTSMAIDKISSALEKAQGGSAPGGAPKNDIDKAKEYIDLFKGMIKKQ